MQPQQFPNSRGAAGVPVVRGAVMLQVKTERIQAPALPTS